MARDSMLRPWFLDFVPSIVVMLIAAHVLLLVWCLEYGLQSVWSEYGIPDTGFSLAVVFYVCLLILVFLLLCGDGCCTDPLSLGVWHCHV
ncbi:hypothetical protein LINPERPRIM_LOCUS39271 [Linum perenne]